MRQAHTSVSQCSIVSLALQTLLNDLPKLSKPIRHKIIWNLTRITAPKLYSDLQLAYIGYHHQTPRPFTKHLQQTYQCRETPLTGCEIGFGYGVNAESILNTLNINQLYCVDAYFCSQPYYWNDILIKDYIHPDKKFHQRLRKMEQSGKVKFIESKSETFFKAFQNMPKFDFIYIDGDHQYKQVYQDLFDSWNMVKEGGWIGGHDVELQEVSNALYDFCKTNNVIPTFKFPDFWFKK